MKNNIIKVYFVLLVMTLAVLAANLGISYLLKASVPSKLWNKESGGVNDLREVVIKINHLKINCPSELILGSSVSKEIDFGNSVNLSYLGAAMIIQNEVVSLVEKSFTGCSRFSTKIFLEILPPLYTKKSIESFADKNDLKLSFLRSWSGVFTKSPVVALELLVLKLRNYTPPEMILRLLKWKFLRQSGEVTSESALSAFDKLYDLKHADFDPVEISRLRSVISRLSKLTDNLVLYVPPQNQKLWQYSSAGSKRVEILLKEIEVATSIAIIRADKEIFEKDEFRDPLHLTTEGASRLVSILKVKSETD